MNCVDLSSVTVKTIPMHIVCTNNYNTIYIGNSLGTSVLLEHHLQAPCKTFPVFREFHSSSITVDANLLPMLVLSSFATIKRFLGLSHRMPVTQIYKQFMRHSHSNSKYRTWVTLAAYVKGGGGVRESRSLLRKARQVAPFPLPSFATLACTIPHYLDLLRNSRAVRAVKPHVPHVTPGRLATREAALTGTRCVPDGP